MKLLFYIYVCVCVCGGRRGAKEGWLGRRCQPKPLLEEGPQPGTLAGWLVTPFQAYGGRKTERKPSLGSNA